MKLTLSAINDRLNPILVKEISQGMRTRTFVSSFLLVQLILVFFNLAFLAVADLKNSSDFTDFYWFSITAPFILFLPMRALGAIHDEWRHKTLEMLLMSNLSSRQIVQGKFYSHIVQMLLLASTIIPYFVIRYFSGEGYLSAELENFANILFTGAILTATAVAISTISRHNRFLFFALRIIFLIYALVLCLRLGFNPSIDMSASSNNHLFTWLALALQAIFFIDFIIILGTFFLKTDDENHWPLLRSHAFIQIALIGVIHIFSTDSIFFSIPNACLILSIITSLFAKESSNKYSYQPQMKNRFLRLIFCPFQISAAIWFNFCCIALGLLHINSHWPHQNISLLILAIPLIYLAITVLITDKLRFNFLSTLVIWLPIPLSLFIAGNQLPYDQLHYILKIVAIYGTLLMPYSFNKFNEAQEKAPLHWGIQLTTFLVFFFFSYMVSDAGLNPGSQVPIFLPAALFNIKTQPHLIDIERYIILPLEAIFIYANITYATTKSAANYQRLRSVKEMAKPTFPKTLLAS